MRDSFARSDKLNGEITTWSNSLSATTKDVGATWLELLSIIIACDRDEATSGRLGDRCRPTRPGNENLDRYIRRRHTTSSIHPCRCHGVGAEPPEIVVTGGRVKNVTLDLQPARDAVRACGARRCLASDLKNMIDGTKFGLTAHRKLVLTVNVPRGQPRRHLYRRRRRQQHRRIGRHGQCHGRLRFANRRPSTERQRHVFARCRDTARNTAR